MTSSPAPASRATTDKQLWRTWRYYAGFYRQSRLWLPAYAAMSAGPALLPLPMAWLIRYGFDNALPGHNLKLMSAAAALILLLAFCSSAITLATRRLALNITKTATLRLRQALLDKAYALPRADYAALDRAKSASTVVQETERVDAMSQALVVFVFPALLATVVLAGLLVYLNPLLCLLNALTFPAFLVVSEAIRRRIARSFNEFRRAFRAFNKGTVFVWQMLDLTHLQTAEAFEVGRQQANFESVRETGARVNWLNVAYGEVLNVAVVLTGVLILLVGGQAVVAGNMTLGSLLSFYVGVGLLANVLRPAWNAIPQIVAGNESLKALYRMLETPVVPPYVGTRQLAFTGRIALEGVSFGYGDTPLLRDVELVVEPQNTVAILGPNGAGKSTLTYLVLGLYRPQQGRLYADDAPYDTLDVADLRRQIGVVPQNPILFPGTLWDNITYGFPAAAPAQVEWASRLATAHDFICEFPLRYNTFVGEHGALLSGGQRQRIALARALLRRPPLLILDEPTNHLDRSTVEEFMLNLRALEPAPAIVIISHDHRLAEQAQRVYVLREGRLRPQARESMAAAPQVTDGR